MKIAISGCGIAGTATAILLARDGHDVHIFEQAAECKPVGAGFMLQLPGQLFLKKLGIHDEVIGKSAKLDGLWAKQPSGKTLVRLRYDWLGDQHIGYGIHRGILFQALHDLCLKEGVKITTNFRAVETDYSSTAKASLTNERDERFDGFDFVIGADGSRSAMREHMGLTKYIIDYGFAALWCTGPCDYQPGALVQVVRGTEDLIGLLPIGNGHSSFFYGLRVTDHTAVISQPIEQWKAKVMELCADASSMLDTIQSFDDLTYARYQHVVTKSAHRDHVILLGDAAHATSPHLGQGVSLALEDADCFATSLRETGDFVIACRSFSKQRSWKVSYYQKLTMLLTPFFQSDSPARRILRDTFLPWFPHIPGVKHEMVRTLRGTKAGWTG